MDILGDVDDLGARSGWGVCVGTREVLFWIFWVLARGSLLFLQSQQQQISQIQDCSSMKHELNKLEQAEVWPEPPS